MLRIHGSENFPPGLRGGIAAIGNFDGVHLGHRAVIGHASARARTAGGPALVVTFDPHPRRFFQPALAPFLLTTMEQRLDLLQRLGVDGAIVLNFDAMLAHHDATAFVETVLARCLGLRGCTTGEGFNFGRGRSGDEDSLRTLGARCAMKADVVPALCEDGAIVSSTRIRDAIRRGDVRSAARLLGRRGRSIRLPEPNPHCASISATRHCRKDATRSVAGLGMGVVSTMSCTSRLMACAPVSWGVRHHRLDTGWNWNSSPTGTAFSLPSIRSRPRHAR